MKRDDVKPIAGSQRSEADPGIAYEHIDRMGLEGPWFSYGVDRNGKPDTMYTNGEKAFFESDKINGKIPMDKVGNVTKANFG